MSVGRESGALPAPECVGVERYPFDPLLRPESVDGLDRLRCIADRSYAALLYEIYLLAERNDAELAREQELRARAAKRTERFRECLRERARRALAGELGSEAQELARCLVSDSSGNVSADDRSLDEFGHVLAELGAL